MCNCVMTKNEPREFMNFTVSDVSYPACRNPIPERQEKRRGDGELVGAKSLLEILLDQKVFLPKTVSQSAGPLLELDLT